MSGQMEEPMRGRDSALAVVKPHALRLSTLDEYLKMSEVLAKSTVIPKEYQGKAADILVAMQHGAEIGLPPLQALQSIAVINGRPSVWGDALLGLVMASGQLEEFEETDDPQSQTATCTAKRVGRAKSVTRTFSMADAQRIVMWERDRGGNLVKRALADKDTYKSYPARMRQMRARSWVLRDLFPDILKGIIAREEADDIGAEAPVQGPVQAKPVAGKRLDQVVNDRKPKPVVEPEPQQTTNPVVVESPAPPMPEAEDPFALAEEQARPAEVPVEEAPPPEPPAEAAKELLVEEIITTRDGFKTPPSQARWERLCTVVAGTVNLFEANLDRLNDLLDLLQKMKRNDKTARERYQAIMRPEAA